MLKYVMEKTEWLNLQALDFQKIIFKENFLFSYFKKKINILQFVFI